MKESAIADTYSTISALATASSTLRPSRIHDRIGGKNEGEQCMPKRATQVVLSEKEQETLTRISRRYRSEQQVALRERIVLAAAQGQSNARIARELEINVDTARLWRDRWVGLHGIDLETLSIAER